MALGTAYSTFGSALRRRQRRLKVLGLQHQGAPRRRRQRLGTEGRARLRRPEGRVGLVFDDHAASGGSTTDPQRRGTRQRLRRGHRHADLAAERIEVGAYRQRGAARRAAVGGPGQFDGSAELGLVGCVGRTFPAIHAEGRLDVAAAAAGRGGEPIRQSADDPTALKRRLVRDAQRWPGLYLSVTEGAGGSSLGAGSQQQAQAHERGQVKAVHRPTRCRFLSAGG